MSPVCIRKPLFIVVFAIILALPCLAAGQIDVLHKAEESSFDCGTLSLYLLLRIEGRATALPAIESRLPPMPRDGYSMKELREAARGCGLRISGVRLKDPARDLDRPAIAFLKQGHYVIVRPVGHTGRLVQVVDGTEFSAIMESEELFRSPNWSGLVLIPRGYPLERSAAIAFLCIMGAGMLLILIPRLRRVIAVWWLRRATCRDALAPGRGARGLDPVAGKPACL
jgi:Peptidase C39 family